MTGCALLILGSVIFIAIQFLHGAPSIAGPQYINRDLKIFSPEDRKPMGAVHVLLTIPSVITIGSDAQAEIRIAPTALEHGYMIGSNATATLTAGDLGITPEFAPPAPYVLPWLFTLSGHARGAKILHYHLSLPLKNARTGKTITWPYDSFESLQIAVLDDFWGTLALVASMTVIVFGLITTIQGLVGRGLFETRPR
jgi:hypothetical protein